MFFMFGLLLCIRGKIMCRKICKLEGMDHMRKTENKDEKDAMDKLLEAAFTEMVEQEYANRPRRVRRHHFSRRFKKNMKAMLRTVYTPEEAERKPAKGGSLVELMRPIRSRRAVVVVAVLALLLFGTTANGTNPIILWLHDSWMEQHGDYVEIENRENGVAVSEEGFRKYELAELPEGYEVIEEQWDESVSMYMVTYSDADGNIFMFRQGRKDNKNLGNFTAERKELEEVKIGELEGYYLRDENLYNLVLSDEEYMLVFSGELSKEEFAVIADGLRAVK